MQTEALDELFSAHLRTVAAHTGEALAATGHDALVLHSGGLRTVDFDDALGHESEGALEGGPQGGFEDQNPRKALLRKELAERIRRALADLPEYHQAVIVLREVDGLSYEELAEVMEVPKGTIMSRLFHARRKMQEALGTYLDRDLEIED